MDDKKLMQVSCDPDCGFMIRSHDQNELVNDVKAHTENIHDMKSTDKDIMEKITFV